MLWWRSMQMRFGCVPESVRLILGCQDSKHSVGMPSSPTDSLMAILRHGSYAASSSHPLLKRWWSLPPRDWGFLPWTTRSTLVRFLLHRFGVSWARDRSTTVVVTIGPSHWSAIKVQQWVTAASSFNGGQWWLPGWASLQSCATAG